MDTVKALKIGIQIVEAILAVYDRYKAFKEWNVVDPVKKQNHYSKHLYHMLHVVLSVLQEIVHVQ